MEIETRPKKARKPQRRSVLLRDAIQAVAARYEHMSVRQLFYQLEAQGVIPKTEAAYDKVCYAAVQMRLDGSLDYRKIVDGHRARRLAATYDDMQEALDNMHTLYRRNHWLDQPVWVEVWCEKDALSGVIQPICQRWGVPFVATRGFPSLTLIYESAHEMRARGKQARVYYFGDHDASGRAISANLEGDLRAHWPFVSVRRMALEPEQIARYHLPTRPGKTTDSRHKGFAAQYGGASVELDALPPDVLTGLVEDCITRNIIEESWMGSMQVERLERETLSSVAGAGLRAGRLYSLPQNPEP